ncbi:ephrin-B2-like [Tribolium madens]|uniref:ephrin-B2-like n=1 Tax=Tribolium madens TaxID=41895 RepID=UPI001CF73A31|nr:ephrin-B2-like [Tribolium madens]
MAVLIKKCSLILPGFRTTSCLTVVLLVCMETVFLCTQSTCSKTFQVHWNTSDSIFRIDNTDHIIDVNKGNAQFEYDQVNIICPVYTPGTYGDDLEKYIIYNVSKEEYETCRITNPNPRIIAICDKPYKLMYFTITFRPFTPQPGGLEFLPGKDYYFISTSSKDDLHRRIGGRCSTNNMKIVFKVCCAPDQNQNNFTTKLTSTSTTTLGWPDIRRPMVEVTSSSTTQWVSRTDTPSTRKPTKKMNEYEKHPNEVMKNEELTYSKGVWLSAGPPSFLVVIACIAVIRWR